MIIGLTGGIGSGKSAVCNILAAKNAYIIDTDHISREVSAEGTECNLKLKAAFNDCVIGGALQRGLLRQRVFGSESDRLLLNGITHPYILEGVKERLKGKKMAVVAVPLLFESGFDRLCGYTVCIIAPLEQRVQRVMQRDKTDRETVLKIIASQAPDSLLVEKSDYAIYNDGSLAQLKQKVTKWWSFIGKSF